MEQDFSFDEWFDIFQDKCKEHGYTGLIDKYSFEWNYVDGETPEYAAEQFVKEMKEDA